MLFYLLTKHFVKNGLLRFVFFGASFNKQEVLHKNVYKVFLCQFPHLGLIYEIACRIQKTNEENKYCSSLYLNQLHIPKSSALIITWKTWSFLKKLSLNKQKITFLVGKHNCINKLWLF